MIRMAYHGKKPFEIVSALVRGFGIPYGVMEKHSGVSGALISNMCKDCGYSKHIVNEKFMKLMEFFGYDVEIILRRNEDYTPALAKLSLQEQIDYQKRVRSRENKNFKRSYEQIEKIIDSTDKDSKKTYDELCEENGMVKKRDGFYYDKEGADEYEINQFQRIEANNNFDSTLGKLLVDVEETIPLVKKSKRGRPRKNPQIID